MNIYELPIDDYLKARYESIEQEVLLLIRWTGVGIDWFHMMWEKQYYQYHAGV